MVNMLINIIVISNSMSNSVPTSLVSAVALLVFRIVFGNILLLTLPRYFLLVLAFESSPRFCFTNSCLSQISQRSLAFLAEDLGQYTFRALSGVSSVFRRSTRFRL